MAVEGFAVDVAEFQHFGFAEDAFGDQFLLYFHDIAVRYFRKKADKLFPGFIRRFTGMELHDHMFQQLFALFGVIY
jgi:hypothetical protein